MFEIIGIPNNQAKKQKSEVNEFYLIKPTASHLVQVTNGHLCIGMNCLCTEVEIKMQSVGLSFSAEKNKDFDCFTYIYRGKKHIVQWLSGRFQLCHCS